MLYAVFLACTAHTCESTQTQQQCRQGRLKTSHRLLLHSRAFPTASPGIESIAELQARIKLTGSCTHSRHSTQCCSPSKQRAVQVTVASWCLQTPFSAHHHSLHLKTIGKSSPCQCTHMRAALHVDKAHVLVLTLLQTLQPRKVAQ